jgi:hypothetical protein
MIVEMRTYQTRPGTRDRFLQTFQELTLPEHYRLGMKIAGPFLAVDDPDTFFFMRGFQDMVEREELRRAFYEGALWKEQLEKVLMPMLLRFDVLLVDDPGGSLAWNEPATGGSKGDDIGC